jgi:hypothetical protein
MVVLGRRWPSPPRSTGAEKRETVQPLLLGRWNKEPQEQEQQEGTAAGRTNCSIVGKSEEMQLGLSAGLVPLGSVVAAKLTSP